MQLGISSKFDKSHGFENIETTLINMLKDEGFGILTEIDVHAVMLKKGQQWERPYKILGACNPPHANKVLKTDPEIGLLLPCNVIIYENAEEKIVVSLINASGMFELIDDDSVKGVADLVSQSFDNVLAKLKEKFA